MRTEKLLFEHAKEEREGKKQFLFTELVKGEITYDEWRRCDSENDLIYMSKLEDICQHVFK